MLLLKTVCAGSMAREGGLLVCKMVNRWARYQAGLTVAHLYPGQPGACACGCGQPLSGRRTRWASKECSNRAYIAFAIVKGDGKIIRQELWKMDQGCCRSCGVFDDFWQADHVLEVALGGGACGIENLQTLCRSCHAEKTASFKAVPVQAELFATGDHLVHDPLERAWGHRVGTSEDVRCNAGIGVDDKAAPVLHVLTRNRRHILERFWGERSGLGEVNFHDSNLAIRPVMQDQVRIHANEYSSNGHIGPLLVEQCDIEL